MATFLLTGAAGFIGFHTARRLLERGDRVVGVDNINAYYSTSLKRDRLARLKQYPGFTFDEINIAMRYEYLSVQEVIAGLEARDARTGVILTGRDAKPELCEYADLVTEMSEVKHPFKAGIKAQRGVDY